MKRSRPLSLFLIFLILVSCFVIPVSASDSENLINSDLTEWTLIDHGSYSTVGEAKSGLYFLQSRCEKINESVQHLYYSHIYELNNFVAGHSYSFNIHLLSVSDLLNDYGISRTDSSVYGGFQDGYATITIGLASYNASLESFDLAEGCYITIDSSNYQYYFGRDISVSFEMPNISNPCIMINYMDISTRTATVYTYFSDVSLIDNTVSEEEGFFNKLFEWFQEKFDDIGDRFSNLGNKLSELKNSFNNALSNLGDSIGSFFDEQLEGIKDFFRGFGNLILYFNWEGEYTNPFESSDSPIDDVSSFFDNLVSYVDSIGTSIENVLDSITGGLHIFDEFTSRFPWLKAIAIFCLALIVITRFIGL